MTPVQNGAVAVAGIVVGGVFAGVTTVGAFSRALQLVGVAVIAASDG